MPRMVLIAVLAVVALNLGVGAAYADTPPTPEQAMEPSRNAADFDTLPWSPATLKKHADNGRRTGDRAAVGRAPGQARSTTRPVQAKAFAAHPGVVTCTGHPSIVQVSSTVSAEGYVTCINGPADLLGEMNCVDLWATGGYWTTLSCGQWKTCAGCSYIAGYFHARPCTPGRYYRGLAKISVVHGNNVSQNYPSAYNQC